MAPARALGGLLLLAAVTVIGGCGGSPDGPPPGAPPDAPGTVLILVFSGMAAGDDGARALEEDLSREPETVTFERHYTASPETQRSVSALFSGYPVVSASTAAGGDGPSDGPPVLAELFSRMGYATFAVVTDERLSADHGFGRGFATYEFRPGMTSTEQREWLREHLSRARGPVLGFVQVDESDRDTVESWIETLRGLDRFPRTLLVVTSDHGTASPVPSDAGSLFRDAVVRVPCVVKFPRDGRPESAAPRTTSLTSSVDLLPALLARVGRDVSGALPGSNVFDGMFSGHALLESDDGWAFVEDRYKVVVVADGTSLFDLVADPDEQHDLAGGEPDRAEQLLADAAGVRAALAAGAGRTPGSEEELDEETLEHLRSLGYIQ